MAKLARKVAVAFSLKRDLVFRRSRDIVFPGGALSPLLQPACLFARKGYRTDATVSVFLGFLLFLIPAKKPCFGKKKDGERSSRGEVGAGSSPITPKSAFSGGA